MAEAFMVPSRGGGKTYCLEQFEKKVEELKEQTCYDEDIIGCFLSNYYDRHVCSRFHFNCKNAVKCNNLENICKK